MKSLITGGAGFIGGNLACRLMDAGHEVILLDNLSRTGTHSNKEWLQSRGTPHFVRGDIRDSERLENLFREHPDIDRV